jgi:hypothetical protein
MQANIIDLVLSKAEYIDFVFEMEDKFDLLKKTIIEHYRLSLVEKLKATHWIVIDNLDFGKPKEYLVFYKECWKRQFVLYFEGLQSDLRIGITPQFQTDIDWRTDSLIQKALENLKTDEFHSENYWIWLDGINLSDFTWSDIYLGELTNKTVDQISKMAKILEKIQM